MNNQLISIIVPAYNAEKYIGRCIESILSQTYQNIQVIVVDDGSTDNTSSIIECYSEKDSRVYYIYKDNTGVADARNTGLDFASGDYIGFVDSDDYIEPEMYERMYSKLIETDADVCCCGYYQDFSGFRYEICPDANLVSNKDYYITYGTINILRQYFRQDIRTGIGDGNWNKLFKAKNLNNIRYERLSYCEDVEFQVRVFSNCSKIVCISDILYHYYDNIDSVTKVQFNDARAKVLDVVDGILSKIVISYPEILEETYSFHLNWYLSILQNTYLSNKSNIALKSRKRISQVLRQNLRHYLKNKFSKRLDQFYLIACITGMMRFAMFIKNRYREIIPSRDVIRNE